MKFFTGPSEVKNLPARPPRICLRGMSEVDAHECSSDHIRNVFAMHNYLKLLIFSIYV